MITHFCIPQIYWYIFRSVLYINSFDVVLFFVLYWYSIVIAKALKVRWEFGYLHAVVSRRNGRGIKYFVSYQASPATVSRCGMVYVGGNTVTWTSLLHKWLHIHAHDTWWDEYAHLLQELANWLIPPSLAFVMEHCHYLLPITEVSLVRYEKRVLKTNIPKLLGHNYPGISD